MLYLYLYRLKQTSEDRYGCYSKLILYYFQIKIIRFKRIHLGFILRVSRGLFKT